MNISEFLGILKLSKRLLKLSHQMENNKNIDNIIATFKPPIFWKEKEIVKQQMRKWSYKKVMDLLIEINEIVLLIKKNSNNSVNILSNFILEKSSLTNN